jgi:hypothetical protein
MLLVCLTLLGLCGCKENPGKWAPAKVSTEVGARLEITGLVLTPSTKGLEGSGKRSDGETITVIVTQDANLGEIRWDAKGDRGFVEEGNFSLR